MASLSPDVERTPFLERTLEFAARINLITRTRDEEHRFTADKSQVLYIISFETNHVLAKTVKGGQCTVELPIIFPA